MGERTEHAHGTHSWVDLSTDDLDGAKAFYSGLFGWTFDDQDAGDGMIYSMASLDGRAVAAAFRGDGTLPVHWNNYVTVDDVDGIAQTIEQAGGVVMMPPMDVLDAGRMLVLQDPTGAFLSLWQAKERIGAELVNVPGALTWNDLSTSDPEKAMAFYEAVLGWDFEAAPGEAEYWVISNDGRSNGGVRREDRMPPFWMPYFACEDAEATGRRIEELGGRVMVPATEVPNGTFVVAGDPQGGAFAVFAGEFDD